MTMFEYLKELCERKGISIHKLEMDLGFSNGSLSKANTIPLKRAALIADYFGITIEQLWNMEYPEDTFDPVSGYPIYADVEDENGELTLLGRVGTSYIKNDFLSTVTEDEIEILARLRSIPEKDKARVLDLLDSYYQEYKDEKKDSSLA